MPSTLILGASEKSDRYANKAQKQLLHNGHKVLLVNPRGDMIDGIECYKHISEVQSDLGSKGLIDTVTVYVNPAILSGILPDIASLNPRRVILNPGTESNQARDYFVSHNIEVLVACTLVLLSLGRY